MLFCSFSQISSALSISNIECSLLFLVRKARLTVKKKNQTIQESVKAKDQVFCTHKTKRSFQATPIRPRSRAAVGAAPGTNVPLLLSVSPVETWGGASHLPCSLHCPRAFLGQWGDGREVLGAGRIATSQRLRGHWLATLYVST